MAVPRNRSSNARKNSRRAHHAKSPKNAISCPNCKGKKMSHKVCPHCGHYAGRNIVQ